MARTSRSAPFIEWSYAIDKSINSQGIKIFPNDSKINERVGAGVAIYENNILKEEHSYHLPTHDTVYQAELVTILKALELSRDASSVTIYSVITHGTSKPYNKG